MISAALCWTGGLLTKLLLPANTSMLPMVSMLTVGCSTAFPRFFRRLSSVGNIMGVLMIQMFFVASGAAGSLIDVLRNAPVLFAFSSLQILLHYLLLVGVGGGLLKLRGRELYIASNANVGGPTTAAAMAKGKGWEDLVMPGLLVGIAGYACGTVLGIALGLGPLKQMANAAAALS